MFTAYKSLQLYTTYYYELFNKKKIRISFFKPHNKILMQKNPKLRMKIKFVT